MGARKYLIAVLVLVLLFSIPGVCYASPTVAPGSGTLTAAIGSVTSNDIPFTVQSPQLASLTLAGTVPTLTVGGSVYNLSGLTLTGKDTNGNIYSLNGLSPTFAVAAGSSFASVNGGLLNPVAAGSGTLTAAIGSVTSNDIPFTVQSPQLASLTLAGTVPTLKVQDISSLPGSGWQTKAPSPGQEIPEQAVRSELAYLSQNQVLDTTPINVCLYDQQVSRTSEGASVAYGGTSFDGNIYIFAGYWSADAASSAIVHEIGHLVRHLYVTDSELQTYMGMRGVTNTPLMDGVTSLWEELFAEDFRTLFGDGHAQVPQYDFYNTISRPNEQDKEFIEQCISSNGAAVGGFTPVMPAVGTPMY